MKTNNNPGIFSKQNAKKTYITKDLIVGCLIGTSVGDAFGLCCEGMSKNLDGEKTKEMPEMQLR